MKGSAWKLFVLALVVMIVAAALVVPVVAGAVAVGRPTAGDGSTAAECQSGHSCGGAPVAAMYPGHIRWPGYECQSGFSCGGRQVAVWPLPGTNAVCQSGAACGG